MFAIITTEEYKELIQAQGGVAELEDAILYEKRKRKEAEDSLKELLLKLTNGKAKPELGEDKFNWFEIVDREIIVDYINNNYMTDGKLQFEKVTKDESFAEKVAKAFAMVKENTDEQSN